MSKISFIQCQFTTEFWNSIRFHFSPRWVCQTFTTYLIIAPTSYHESRFGVNYHLIVTFRC